MFSIFNQTDIPQYTPQNRIGVEKPLYTSGVDPIEPPINFDTLNTLTKEHYSPQARVNRMLLHAKGAAEKGSWWCNIPEVGGEEVALLKGLGFRVYRKDSQVDYQYSLNWGDKSVAPKDTSLVEL